MINNNHGFTNGSFEGSDRDSKNQNHLHANITQTLNGSERWCNGNKAIMFSFLQMARGIDRDVTSKVFHGFRSIALVHACYAAKQSKAKQSKQH